PARASSSEAAVSRARDQALRAAREAARSTITPNTLAKHNTALVLMVRLPPAWFAASAARSSLPCAECSASPAARDCSGVEQSLCCLARPIKRGHGQLLASGTADSEGHAIVH